jgi:hypothetical protein
MYLLNHAVHSEQSFGSAERKKKLRKRNYSEMIMANLLT